MSALGRKATEAYTAAARRVSDAITSVTNNTNNNKDGKSSSGGRSGRKTDGEGGENGASNNTRCADAAAAPYGFLENMCGPMLRNFNTDGSDDADDLTARNLSSRNGSGGRRGGESDRGRGGRSG